MKYYKKFVGERVYLSPVNSDDAESYIKWMNDKAVATNYGQFHLVVSSKNDLSWIFEPPSDMQRYAIVLLDNDVLIGNISVQNINHINRNAFIGIFIGEAAYRGKGYGLESIRLILNYCFMTLNLHSVNLTVYANNPAGISCYTKAGFREVGRLPEALFIDGEYVDKIYMAILEDEFNRG